MTQPPLTLTEYISRIHKDPATVAQLDFSEFRKKVVEPYLNSLSKFGITREDFDEKSLEQYYQKLRRMYGKDGIKSPLTFSQYAYAHGYKTYADVAKLTPENFKSKLVKPYFDYAQSYAIIPDIPEVISLYEQAVKNPSDKPVWQHIFSPRSLEIGLTAASIMLSIWTGGLSAVGAAALASRVGLSQVGMKLLVDLATVAGMEFPELLKERDPLKFLQRTAIGYGFVRAAGPVAKVLSPIIQYVKKALPVVEARIPQTLRNSMSTAWRKASEKVAKAIMGPVSMIPGNHFMRVVNAQYGLAGQAANEIVTLQKEIASAHEDAIRKLAAKYLEDNPEFTRKLARFKDEPLSDIIERITTQHTPRQLFAFLQYRGVLNDLNYVQKTAPELLIPTKRYIEELKIFDDIYQDIKSRLKIIDKKLEVPELPIIPSRKTRKEVQKAISETLEDFARTFDRKKAELEFMAKFETLQLEHPEITSTIAEKIYKLVSRKLDVLARYRPDPHLWARITLAQSPVGAMRARNPVGVAEEILTASEEGLDRLLRNTILQPIYYDTFFKIMNTLKTAKIPEEELITVAEKVLRHSVHKEEILKLFTSRPLSLPAAIRSKLSKKDYQRLFQMIDQGYPAEEVVSYLMSIIKEPVLKDVYDAVSSRIARVVEDPVLIRRYTSGILARLYGLHKAETTLGKVLETEFGDYFVATSIRPILAFFTGEPSKASTVLKILDYFNITSKGIFLAFSPFHALSLIKSYAYSTADIATAAKEALRMTKYIMTLRPQAYVDFMWKQTRENIKALRELLGKEFLDVPVVLGGPVEIEGILRKEAQKLSSALKDVIFGRKSMTAMIFEGLYPYLKTKDALEVAKLYKAGKISYQEALKLFNDINWAYGGIPELMMAKPDVRAMLRLILLAPDWQLSLAKQWFVPLTSGREKALRYLTSTLAWSYVMYQAQNPHLDAEETFRRFAQVLEKGANPFVSILQEGRFAAQFDPLGYEKELLDWIHGFMQFLTTGNLQEITRTYFNRASIPVRSIAMLRDLSQDNLSPYFEIYKDFPFLVTLPIPLQYLLTAQEVHGLKFYEALPLALLSSMSYRVHVVPPGKLLSRMIRQKNTDLDTLLLYDINMRDPERRGLEEYFRELGFNVTKWTFPQVLRGAKEATIYDILFSEHKTEFLRSESALELYDIADKIYQKIYEWYFSLEPEARKIITPYLPSLSEVRSALIKRKKQQISKEFRYRWSDTDIPDEMFGDED